MEVPDYGIYADKDWPEPQKGHAAMITRLDRSVGRLVQKLKDLGIEDNTIVSFTSDNGPHREGGADPKFFHSSGPLRGIKRDLYEGGIRVPLIARWPGRVRGGAVTDHVSAFWDFLPTLGELVVVDPAGGGWATCDGISMLPTLLGKSDQQKKHELLYWEFHEGGSIQAVRMDRWKAVRPVGKPLELYDLQTDLGETNNVADSHPDVVAKIEKYLTTARTESEFWPLRSTGVPPVNSKTTGRMPVPQGGKA
jgi:arylsulfatase A-like enzyme